MRLFLILALILALTACGKKAVKESLPEEEQPAELLTYGDQFFQNGDYENAFRMYGAVYHNFPTSREYIDGAIGLSKCYGAMEKYEEEFDILYELLSQNLIPSKVPTVYNSIAHFYEKSAGISEQLNGEGTEDYETAINYYKKAIDYSNSDDAVSKSFAQYKIGTLYERLDKDEDAITAYELAMRSFEGTEWALRAEQNIADLQGRMQRRSEFELRGMLPDKTETPETDEYIYEPEEEEPVETPPTTMPDTTLTPPPATIPPLDSTLVQPDTSNTEPPRF